jgi:beta-phosphoglucomutase
MIKAVIFDLDGVIVSTDELHYQAWKKMAQEEGIDFNREQNERCRGVSRMESLEVVLEKSKQEYTPDQKHKLAEKKNLLYKELLKQLSPADILPGAKETVTELKKRLVRVAIGSSSKNARPILEKIEMLEEFDAIADGNDISKGKPDPEVFLIAARRCNVEPENCLVVEDAEAGVSAALNGNMKVLAVGSAADDPRANLKAETLKQISVDELLAL